MLVPALQRILRVVKLSIRAGKSTIFLSPALAPTRLLDRGTIYRKHGDGLTESTLVDRSYVPMKNINKFRAELQARPEFAQP